MWELTLLKTESLLTHIIRSTQIHRSRHIKQYARLSFGGSDTHTMSLFPGYIGPVMLH